MTDQISADFECCASVDQRCPDEIEKWPINIRMVTDVAIQRLLDKNPGRSVVSDRGRCIDKSHPRFPEGARTEFVLVRMIKLDRAVRADAA